MSIDCFSPQRNATTHIKRYSRSRLSSYDLPAFYLLLFGVYSRRTARCWRSPAFSSWWSSVWLLWWTLHVILRLHRTLFPYFNRRGWVWFHQLNWFGKEGDRWRVENILYAEHWWWQDHPRREERWKRSYGRSSDQRYILRSRGHMIWTHWRR